MKQARTFQKAGNSDIEYLVLKNFIAVIKKNGLYPMFRCSVGWGTNNVISGMYRHMNTFSTLVKNQSKENIYKDAGNIDSFVSMMKDSMSGGMRVGSSDEKHTQHHIANCVNMLLHIFIERNVRDIRVLENLGGEIFDRTCRDIYGNEFKDMLPPPPPNVEKMRELNQKLLECGGRPSEEMMEEIRRLMEEQQRYRENHENEFDGGMMMPEGYVPMVDDEDLDFLDNFLGDENAEEEAEEENEEWLDEDDWFDDEDE